MFKSTIDKLREKFSDYKKTGSKKVIEYMVLVAVMGVIIIMMANSLWGGKQKISGNTEEVSKAAVQNETADLNYKLEKKLAQILADIQGVGRVSVMITYSSGPENIIAKDSKRSENDTKEKDAGGGEREISQKEQDDKLVFVEEQNGVKRPVVLKQMASSIMGVVVVADGANYANVRTDIVRAVEAAAGVPEQRIRVFKRHQ